MLDIKFTVLWDNDSKHWRVVGSDGKYWNAPTLERIPAAINGMLKAEAAMLAGAL